MNFQGYAQDIWRGVDLSYVNEMEDCGTVYPDFDGVMPGWPENSL